MKALFALITLALLTGCGSLTLALKSAQELYSDLQKSKVIEMVSADKANTSKLETSAHVDTLPPPSTTDFTKSTSTPSATSTVVPPMPLDPGPFFPSEVLKVGSRGETVLGLEKRLRELRYDVGAVDGFYDQQTWQGVVAFQ